MPRELFDDDNAPFEIAETDLDGVDNPDAGVVYTIRSLSDETYETLEAKHRPPARYNPKTHQKEPQPMSREQNEAMFSDCLDYLLVGWSGVLHKGQPAPCERALKNKLDGPTRLALFKAARLNRKVQARAESFRGAA